jgi:hypothetical protein
MVDQSSPAGSAGARTHIAAPSASAAVPRTPKSNADTPKEKNTSSFVFLRLKRKRTDDPMERLVVHSEPDSKRSKADLLQAFTQLSTTEKKFVFKHIDTMEQQPLTRTKWTERLKRKARSLKDERADMLARKPPVFQKQPTAAPAQTQSRVQQQQNRSKARRKEGMLKSRGLQPVLEIKEKQAMELHGIRLVDLQVSAAPSKPKAGALTDAEIIEKSKADVVTINGARLKPTRVLNPHERELDEAIWNAFRSNDFAPFFHIYNAQRPELRVDPMTFQRPADGSTILMAAALHGRSDVIEVLLRSGSASVLQQDWEGTSAAVFAKRGGHANVETALLACEEAEHEKDYVYDVYCVDISASEEHSSAHDTATSSDSEPTSVNGVPVVSVSSEVQRWLSEDAPSDEVEEYMLESDIDSNEEVDGYACLYRYPWDR